MGGDVKYFCFRLMLGSRRGGGLLSAARRGTEFLRYPCCCASAFVARYTALQIKSQTLPEASCAANSSLRFTNLINRLLTCYSQPYLKQRIYRGVRAVMKLRKTPGEDTRTFGGCSNPSPKNNLKNYQSNDGFLQAAFNGHTCLLVFVRCCGFVSCTR